MVFEPTEGEFEGGDGLAVVVDHLAILGQLIDGHESGHPIRVDGVYARERAAALGG